MEKIRKILIGKDEDDVYFEFEYYRFTGLNVGDINKMLNALTVMRDNGYTHFLMRHDGLYMDHVGVEPCNIQVESDESFNKRKADQEERFLEVKKQVEEQERQTLKELKAKYEE